MPARADTYPSHPIRIVVPTGPGGITNGVNLALKQHLPYDTIKDFVGVTTLTTVSLVLTVPPSLAAKSVQELIALSRKERLTYASVGSGSLAHLGAELFRSMAHIELTHVPYRSAPAAQQALISGEVSMFFDTPITAVPMVRDGRLRALGVSTPKRSALLPDVPTIAEAGVPGYVVLGWNGILAPAATPQPIVQKLNQELCAILEEPEVKKKLAQQGADLAPTDPQTFAKLIVDDVKKSGDVIRSAGIRPE